MSRPKMTEAHRTQMRDQILDRAYAILIEKGPEHISSRAIAQNLDLTHMGLFTYFSNQAAILNALVEREQRKFLDQMQGLKKRAVREDTFLLMEEGLTYLQQFARSDPNLFRLAWVEPASMNESSPSSWFEPAVDLVADLIQSGMEKGVFHTGSAHLTALLVIGLANIPFLLETGGKINDSREKEQLSQEALAVAMHYLRTGTEIGLTGKKTLPGWLNLFRSWFRKIL